METDDLPLVAKKYSTFSKGDKVELDMVCVADVPMKRPDHLSAIVCRQQLGLIIEWCISHGVKCYEDTHRHTIVTKNTADIDEFRMAKEDFFESIGVTNINEMNEFSQGWDGLHVSNMDELVVKSDRIDDLESGKHAAEASLDEAESAIDQARLDLNV